MVVGFLLGVLGFEVGWFVYGLSLLVGWLFFCLLLGLFSCLV